MDEQEQTEFVGWLKEQLQPKDDSDFQQKVQELGEDGIKQAHLEFKRAKISQFMTGGRLEKIAELSKLRAKHQQGGQMTSQPYTTKRGNVITASDLAAYKKSGMDFGTPQAMGDWLDTWATPAQPQANAPTVDLNKPRMVRRLNQGIQDYENVSVDQIMREPNTMQVGHSGVGFGKWDTSQYKRHVTPQDTIGMSPAIRNNVQQGWNMQKINPAPKPSIMGTIMKGTLANK